MDPQDPGRIWRENWGSKGKWRDRPSCRKRRWQTALFLWLSACAVRDEAQIYRHGAYRGLGGEMHQCSRAAGALTSEWLQSRHPLKRSLAGFHFREGLTEPETWSSLLFRASSDWVRHNQGAFSARELKFRQSPMVLYSEQLNPHCTNRGYDKPEFLWS